MKQRAASCAPGAAHPGSVRSSARPAAAVQRSPTLPAASAGERREHFRQCMAVGVMAARGDQAAACSVGRIVGVQRCHQHAAVEKGHALSAPAFESALGLGVSFGAHQGGGIAALAGGPQHGAPARHHQQLGIGIRRRRQLDALGHHVEPQARARAEVECAPHGAGQNDAACTVDGEVSSRGNEPGSRYGRQCAILSGMVRDASRPDRHLKACHRPRVRRGLPRTTAPSTGGSRGRSRGAIFISTPPMAAARARMREAGSCRSWARAGMMVASFVKGRLSLVCGLNSEGALRTPSKASQCCSTQKNLYSTRNVKARPRGSATRGSQLLPAPLALS